MTCALARWGPLLRGPLVGAPGPAGPALSELEAVFALASGDSGGLPCPCLAGACRCIGGLSPMVWPFCPLCGLLSFGSLLLVVRPAGLELLVLFSLGCLLWRLAPWACFSCSPSFGSFLSAFCAVSTPRLRYRSPLWVFSPPFCAVASGLVPVFCSRPAFSFGCLALCASWLVAVPFGSQGSPPGCSLIDFS